MKILHTSDWHLGHRLSDRDRTDEHDFFLKWLLSTIKEQEVDVLLIAGDIFDTGSPPNYALKQYYDFLRSMIHTSCRHIVIIGGNHDSAATLNAPKELLKSFNIHVIGCTSENIQDEVIEICDGDGNCLMVVCAVPFLRDRDIRYSVSGESYEERERRIKEGICNHYNKVAELVEEKKAQKLPIIAMGHLYAAGGEASESEKEIHIGNLGQISGDQFPAMFDYVALGHLHRPQVINKKEHIRYSGSPIPLSFSEISDTKQIVMLDYEKEDGLKISTMPVPVCRKLIRFKGDLESICFKIRNFDDSHPVTPWAEVQLELEKYEPEASARIYEAAQGKNLVILKVTNLYLGKKTTLSEHVEEELDLDEMNVKDVFTKRLESAGLDDDNKDIISSFHELLNWMEESKEQ